MGLYGYIASTGTSLLIDLPRTPCPICRGYLSGGGELEAIKLPVNLEGREYFCCAHKACFAPLDEETKDEIIYLAISAVTLDLELAGRIQRTGTVH